MMGLLLVVALIALIGACVQNIEGGPTPFPSSPGGGLPFSRGGGSGVRLPGSLAPVQPGAGDCGCEGGGGGAGRCFPSAYAPLPAPGPSPCSRDGNSPR